MKRSPLKRKAKPRSSRRRLSPAHSLAHADRIIGAISRIRRDPISASPAEPRFRYHPKRPPTEVELARWRTAVVAHCQNEACLSGIAVTTRHQHHGVYRSHVRSLAGDEWDPANSMTLCASCHEAHHSSMRTIALTSLPDEVIGFAVALMGPEGAWSYLTRRYDGSDRRVDRLIEDGN